MHTNCNINFLTHNSILMFEHLLCNRIFFLISSTHFYFIYFVNFCIHASVIYLLNKFINNKNCCVCIIRPTCIWITIIKTTKYIHIDSGWKKKFKWQNHKVHNNNHNIASHLVCLFYVFIICVRFGGIWNDFSTFLVRFYLEKTLLLRYLG